MAASQGQHLKVASGTIVHEYYEILREVGCGNFSKVYEVRDTRAPSTAPHLALKIVKREYANDANFERDMLRILGAKGVELQQGTAAAAAGANAVSTMREYFVWNRYPCFVMPLRGPTLRSCKLGIERGHCTRLDVVKLAHSLLTTLKFVHFDCKMVHTDLKPENILLNESVLSSSSAANCAAASSEGPQGDNNKASAASTATAAPTAVDGNLGTGWTVCDFGSASLWRADRMDSDLISTRPYRAPEVVLGNPWSYPADTWSLGCILYEAAVGSRLFDVHDDSTHLSFMEKRLGRLPEALAKKSKNSRKYFDPNGNLNKPAAAARSAQGSACRAVAAARCPRSLQEVLGGDVELLDLITSMLQYDPTTRIRVDDALKHPIFEPLQQKPSPKMDLTTPPLSGRVVSVKVQNPNAVLAALLHEKELEVSKRASSSTVSSAATTPEPQAAKTSTSASCSKPASGVYQYRATSTMLACAAAMDSKENAATTTQRKPMSKSASSSALTAMAKASMIAAQRTGSAMAVRTAANNGTTVQSAAAQRVPTYANYALRLKVNSRT